MSHASTFRPRHTRLDFFAAALADAAKKNGATAIECAKVAIAAKFETAAFEVNSLKRRVEINLRRGANDHEIRNRYGFVADRLGLPDCLATAIVAVRRAIYNERLIKRRADRLGHRHPSAFLDRLQETLLIMRWLRSSSEYRHIWPAILESLNEDPRIRRPALYVIEGGRQHHFAQAAE